MALPENPITRKEAYLAGIAGETVEVPETPITREEAYLDAILKNGGGGGTGDGDMKKAVYDKNNNGIVDNAEKVNNHTVEKDVPANAVFTDTVYDDTILSGRVENLEEDVADLKRYFEQTVTLSTSQTTTVTFTDESITTNSVVDPAISVWGIFPEDVTVSNGTCTVVMPKVSSAQTITVRIYVR